MNKYAEFARRVGLVGAVRTALRFRSLITLPILTKTLGVSGYGIWVQILVTVALFQPFIQLGLGNSITRFLPAKDKKEIIRGLFTALLIVLFSSIILSLLLVLSAGFFTTNLLGEGTSDIYIKIASILLILEGLNAVALNSFRIFGQIRRYSFIIVLQTFLEIILISFFVLSGYGLLGAIIALIISKAVVLAAILILIISYAGLAFPDFSLLKPYLAFGIPLISTALFTKVVESIDRYVIAYFMGTSSVGIYSAAYTLGSFAYLSAPFIYYILSPTIFKSYDEGKISEVKTYLSYSWKYYLMLSIPSAFGLSILAKSLLPILTTPEFALVNKSIVPLVSASLILYGIYGLLVQIVSLSKKTRIFAIAFFVAGIINLGLNIILVPYYGIVAAAITTLIAYITVVLIVYYKSRQLIKFDIKIKFIIKSIISSVVMGGIIWILNPITIGMIILSILIGVIVYFGLLLLLKGFGKEELKTLFQTFGLEKLYNKLIQKKNG